MSRPLKAVLTGLLIVTASAVFLLDKNRNTLRSARAAETPTSTTVQAASNATEGQLRQLLLERKQILDRIADSVRKSVEAGRASISEYAQARKVALLGGIDLSNTKGERSEIHREIVKMYIEVERVMEKEIARGRIAPAGLDKVRVARLESEIDLVREQLNE